MTRLTTFRVASGAAFASFGLVILGVAGVQGGPRWEVPVAEMEFFVMACVSAAVLCVVAIWGFAQLRSTRSSLRWIPGILSAASAVAMLAALIGDPTQWPITHPTLSVIVRRLPIPVFLLCFTAWLVTLFVKFRDNSC